MADLKISQLTAASLPLAGTEVLPIVQSSSTVKVATNDLTVKNVRSNATSGILQITGPGAGTTRTMTTPNADFTAARTDAAQSFTGDQTLGTGNLIQGTAAKGVNFTANTPTASMTSQLLNWYEEGTWTPTMTSAAGTTTVNASSARYTRVGDHVFVVFQINYSTDASVGTSDFTIGGLPFTSRSTFNSRGFVTSSNWTGSDYNDGYITIGAAATTLIWAGRAVNQSSRTNAVLLFSADYFAA